MIEILPVIPINSKSTTFRPFDEFQENYTTLVSKSSGIRKNNLVRVLCTRCHFCTPPKTKKIIVKYTFNRAQKVNKTCENTTCVSRDCHPCRWKLAMVLVNKHPKRSCHMASIDVLSSLVCSNEFCFRVLI